MGNHWKLKPKWAMVKAGFPKENGLGLAEAVVAVAVLGAAVVAFVAALSAGSLAAAEQKTEAVAQSLVRSQMEYTQSSPYNPAATYPALAMPAGYSLSLAVGAVPGADSNIQKITVTISKEGQELLSLADYKVNR